MKIAFVSDENKNLESKIASRFARASYVVLVTVDDEFNVKDVKVERNLAAERGSGAGVKIVQLLSDLKADVAVGPSFGPNAMVALNELGIRSVSVPAGTTVKEALKIVKDQLS